MEATVTTFAGLVGGFLLSLLLWYWLTHRVTPTVVFAHAISKAGGEPSDPIYRIKIVNRHKRRGVIDLSLIAQVVYPMAPPFLSAVGATTNNVSVDLVLERSHFFRLAPVGSNTLIRLRPPLDPSRYAPAIADAIQGSPESPLEALLALTPDAYVLVRGLGFDEWSGARKYFESPRYRLDQIVVGGFGSKSLGPVAELYVYPDAEGSSGFVPRTH